MGCKAPPAPTAGFQDKKLRWEFDIRGSYHYYRMLKKQAEGKIDSWAIRWYASVFLNGGLCLHPAVSLVNNIGHDSTGEHCFSTNVFTVAVGKKRVSDFTHDIKESEEAVRAMAEFYRSLKKPLPSAVLNKIKHFIWKV